MFRWLIAVFGWRRYVPAILFAGCLAVLFPPTVKAAPQNSYDDNDLTLGEVRNFDGFLDHHEGIERDLRQNPNLINDSYYVSRHPELARYLRRHPEVREELRENPRRFMNRERRFERYEHRRHHHRRWRRGDRDRDDDEHWKRHHHH